MDTSQSTSINLVASSLEELNNTAELLLAQKTPETHLELNKANNPCIARGPLSLQSLKSTFSERVISTPNRISQQTVT